MNEERRQTEQTILALCPHEIHLLYIMSQEMRKQVVDLSATKIKDPAQNDIVETLDSIVMQMEHDVAEIKRKLGVKG